MIENGSCRLIGILVKLVPSASTIHSDRPCEGSSQPLKISLVPSGDHLTFWNLQAKNECRWHAGPLFFTTAVKPEPSGWMVKTLAGAGTVSLLLKAILVPSGDQSGSVGKN